MCPSIFEGTVSQTSQCKDSIRSNTKNLVQIPHTNLKRFGDRAFCAYAPRLWNMLPDNIKDADSVQNTAENIAISKGVYLTIWTINMSTDYIFSSAFEHYRLKARYIKYQLLLLSLCSLKSRQTVKITRGNNFYMLEFSKQVEHFIA